MLDIIVYFGIVAPIWLAMQYVAMLAQHPFMLACAVAIVVAGAVARGHAYDNAEHV